LEFLEGLFKRIWKTEKQRSAASSSQVLYADHADFLETLVRLCLGANTDVLIRPTDSLSGCAKNVIYLPDSIDIFASYEENIQMYQYIIVKTTAAYSLMSQEDMPMHISLRSASLEALLFINRVNQIIDLNFPQFKIFENEINKKLDMLIAEKSNLINCWRACRSLRADVDLKIAQDIKKEISIQKRNDRIPVFIYTTVPIFLKSDDRTHSSSGLETPKNKRTTEIKKKQGKLRPIKNTQLKDKEVNPVIHSFEKLETLDKYEGGRRFDSGDDELSKHESALDEVDLSHVTTDGESANSIYSIEEYGFHSQSDSHDAVSNGHSLKMYSEWDFKINSYKKNFCSLNVNENLNKIIFYNYNEKKISYSKAISENRKKFIFFKNDQKWLSRQIEGDDIDTSAWSRSFADLKAGHSPALDFYLKKEKKDRDVSILFLFDQSLSTESWIENQEIIKVIKDSLFIAGESLSGILDDVLIASAYSVSRKNCIYNIHKDWKSSWLDSYGSIYAASPTGYTRLGPSVRHSIELLTDRKSKKKLLFVITDGKVSDIDPYEGRYGLYDMKKAISEAERLNIRTVGITLDKEIKNYFRIMFGKYRHMKSADEFSDILLKSLHSLLRN
jgi:nitric oxide reductase NorD protein